MGTTRGSINAIVGAILGIQAAKRDLRVAHTELVAELMAMYKERGSDVVWDYIAVFQIPSEVKAIVSREMRNLDAAQLPPMTEEVA